MFLKWFEDDKLKQYLNYCFDPNNKDANVAYGQAVAMCIGETASVLECEGHYQKILQGEDYQHFLYKALGINAPSLDIADVGKKIDGVKASVISAGTTWKDLSSIVGQYLEGTSAQFKVNFDQTIALLLTRLQSSILKLGRPGSSSDAHIAKMALFIGRYADRPMVIIEASGTRKQITQALLDHGFAVQKEVAQGGKQGGGKGGQKAVRLNFDRLVREGAVVQAGSTQTFKMAAMVNQAALPSRVPVTHVLKAYQPITPAEIERQTKLQTRWGVLGVIVQGWALMQMIKNGAVEPKKILTDPRLYAMIAGPIGAIMEIVDVKVKAIGAYKPLPNGKGLAPNLAFNSSLRTRWFIGGKLLGAVAGGLWR